MEKNCVGESERERRETYVGTLVCIYFICSYVFKTN